jgi:hypothetical protein
VIAPLPALDSSLARGCADFLGSLGARRAHDLRTVMAAARSRSPSSRCCGRSPVLPPVTTLFSAVLPVAVSLLTLT